MTYQELKEKLETLSPEQLNMDVIVYEIGSDEYYGVGIFNVTQHNDVLDENHPYLAI